MEKIIKAILVSEGITQKQMADDLNVTPQAVNKWIKGTGRPSQDTVILIYERYGIDLTKEMVKDSRKKKKGEQMKTLIEIDNYEKAREEASVILEEAGIEQKYSHPIYKLCTWLVPAVIGLAHHMMVVEQDYEYAEYSDIGVYLKSYLEKGFGKIMPGVYENDLERSFYMMGMDLFESFDEQKISDHDYVDGAMKDWYKFKEIIITEPSAPVYYELRTAISEIAEFIIDGM